MTPERIGFTCISCKGLGLTGFFGVATIPCWRCGGSGRDPHPGDPYPEPKVYSYATATTPTSEGREE